MSTPWSFREADNDKCPFNSGVECGGASPCRPGSACFKCGWNPDIRKARARKWKQANAERDFSAVVDRKRRHGRR